MADENIDSLQIEISSSATDAKQHIDGLISSLRKLDRIGKAAGLSSVRKQLEGIAAVKFDNISGQLKDVVSYVNQLQTASRRLGEIAVIPPTINTETVTAPLGEMVDEVHRASEEIRSVGETFGETTVTKPDWLDDMQDECQSIVDSFEVSTTSLTEAKNRLQAALDSKRSEFSTDKTFVGGSNLMDSFSDKFTRLNLQAEILEQKLESLMNSENVDLTTWDTLQKQLLTVRLQYQALEQQINKNADAVNRLGEESKKSQSKFGKFLSSMKRILMYRMVRAILSGIAKAAREGLQNIAKFSQEANSILSEYKTEFTYMKNSVGSALIPLLKSLLPIMIRIGDAFVDVTNSIGMIGAAINGDSTFVKAKKYAQDYAETLEEVKKSTTGFDELNILGKQDNSANDTSKMFEETNLNGWDVAGSIAKIAGLAAAVTGLILLFKGISLGSFFGKIGKGISGIWKYLKNASVWKKAGISIAAIAIEAVACYNGFYDMFTGARSVGSVLLELIPICAIVGVAMYAMWGPVGLIIMAVVAAVTAFIAGVKAVSEAAKDRAMAEFWNITGVSIEEATSALYSYFNALGIDKQQEWNETLAESIANLNEVSINYNTLWHTLSDGGEASTKIIQKLGSAFNELAEAANAVNDAAIGTLMASIATGIQMNITPELTARLGELVTSLEVAQDLLNSKITGINAEYQKLLGEITNNGGKYTPEQYERLKQLRSELDTYTLTDQSASEGWNLTLEEMLKKGVVAGFNKDDIASVLNELMEERNKYLETMKTSYASNVSTLKRLIALYPELFSEADLAALAESYNATLNEVNNQVNAVVQAIYDTLNANAAEDERAWYKTGFAWIYDWGYYGRKEAYEEQQDILAMILSYLGSISEYEVDIPAHANGGVIEDGLFMANSSEIIGKFTNGKTVAANNDTIIAGIKQGVAEALQENGGQGGDWTIQIVDGDGRIRGETIISAAERKNRRDGKTVISVGG